MKFIKDIDGRHLNSGYILRVLLIKNEIIACMSDETEFVLYRAIEGEDKVDCLNDVMLQIKGGI